MEQSQIEIVGKVFLVVGSMRRCLICDGVFTPTQASEHATTPCSPHTKKSAVHNWKSTQ